MQNNQKIETSSFTKGLNKNLSPSFITGEVLENMRNGILFSHDGEYLTAQTEQSTRLVCTLPFPIIGHIKLPDGTWALFLTDNISSEIGIFDEHNYSYTTKLNAEWLNFNQSNLITGGAKEQQDGSFTITWSDGRRNWDRRLNLSKVTSATKDNILLSILTRPPKLDIYASNGGILPNGNYQATIRYSINQKGFGAYYSMTLPISVWSEQGNNGALEIDIENIDEDFDFFELVVLQARKGTTTAKIIGTYPRATSKIHIAGFDRAEYIPVDIADIVVENQPYIASDFMVSNNQHLFRAGVETIPELNYQLQAFNIESEYVVTQYPENYYSYGNNVGNYRDEVMAYWIQWLHTTGAYSSAFTLPGRLSKTGETDIVGGEDVYEALIEKCDEPPQIPYHKVYNTAQSMIPTNNRTDVECDGIEIGYGYMAYHESTEKYPANEEQFGQWANTPIRHHRYPDEEKCPRFTVRDGKSYINILGVRFKNIERPKKADGTIDEQWVGYRIIRADRNGNRSVNARMLLTNVRGYKETIGSEQKDVLYTNYPVNDLRPDSFISQTQTYFKNNREQNFTPLNEVHYNKFNAYSPHFTYNRYSLGEELKIESEETASVRGHFREVFNHPKGKLLSLFAFWLAAAMGALEALLTVLGKGSAKSESQIKKTALDGGFVNTFEYEYKLENVEDLIGLNITQYIQDAIAGGAFTKATGVIKTIALSLASLGLKVLTFTFFGIQYADQVLDIIYKFLGYTNYSLQYNSHATFNNQTSVDIGNKRRYVKHYQYLQQGLQTINGKLYNNFRKHNSVYIELNSNLAPYVNEDNTRQTIGELGISDDIFKDVSTQGVAYYATSKRNIPNQYGRIESNANFILTHNNYFETPSTDTNSGYTSPVIYGGDCYIVKDYVQTKHHFFSQDMSQPYPPSSIDGEEYDYRQYPNIGRPRFWANFFKYDFSDLITRDVGNFRKFSRTVASRHNLDNKGNDDTNKFRVDNAYFYTSSNCILEYFVESDFNTYFREKSDNDTYQYSDKFTDIDSIFRSDKLLKEEQFKYDTSLNSQANQIYAQQQPSDFDSNVYNEQYKYSRNTLIYSLPSFQEYKFDNWQYFLTANQYEFPKAEFGSLTSVHRVDGDRILFLFDRSSPYITVGRNELKMSNETITIGDGGLFAQPPKELLYTEQHYGNSQSRMGAISTQFGTFYISERQGRFLRFNNSLDEVTRLGLQTWSKQYFPVKLKEYFPTFAENPAFGVGYFTSFDAQIDVIYISKKDYIPKFKEIEYDEKENKFSYKGFHISLDDTNYFDNISFTLSYSPTLNAFMSFHDWYPDWTIPTEKHFLTAKGNKLYIHNDNPFSYCNYYDEQYPFEVTYYVNNKLQTRTLSNLEYYLECYKYKDDGVNKVHLYDENFSHLIVSNSEQISGLLPMHKEGNPYEDILYPKPNNLGYDILYSNIENKIRVNQFWDITKDRQADVHLLHQHPNGYTSQINPAAIDVQKSVFERKDFRHNNVKIHLLKDFPTSKMLLRLAVAKELESKR